MLFYYYFNIQRYIFWHEINIHQFTKRVWSPKINAIFVTLWMLKIHQKVHLFVFHIFPHIFPLAAYVHICFVINFQYQKYFFGTFQCHFQQSNAHCRSQNFFYQFFLHSKYRKLLLTSNNKGIFFAYFIEIYT